MNKTHWRDIAVIGGIWIVVFTLAIFPFDNLSMLSGGLV